MEAELKQIGITFAFLFAITGVCFAQSPDAAKFAAAQQQNTAQLQKFSWKQQTEIQLKGETKKTMLNQMRYDAAGNEQKTLLSEGPPQEAPAQDTGRRGGRVKKKIIENKKEDFKEMMQGLAALVKSYANIPPDKLKAAMAQAEKPAGKDDLQGAVGLRLQNVVQDKDSLVIWIDPATLLFKRIEISTLYEKKPVTAIANYSAIPGGPAYMAIADLQYPEKELVLKIENFDYIANP